MKVFLSWSGDRSRVMAEALRDWLPKVIQSVKPWMSAVDIDRGARWSSDIAVELADTSFGISCLTPENLSAPWIHFEAGALSKTLEKSYVCPYLFQVELADLKGPLIQFNAAKADNKDTLKLVLTINDAQETPLPERTVEESFGVWWPQLKEALNGLSNPQAELKQMRPERDMLEEILELVRGQVRAETLRLETSNLAMLADDSLEVQQTGVFVPGSYVRHLKYGRGLVLRREGVGDSLKLTVSFPGYGQKRLVQKYANLSSA
ncbi:MAG: hypothetical protein JWM21_3753 [Acidobacteria bacterium]|nr:hypothetical protein [Acidobacteriota bacterium]